MYNASFGIGYSVFSKQTKTVQKNIASTGNNGCLRRNLFYFRPTSRHGYRVARLHRQKKDNNIGFQEKLALFAENSDHNIDPR
jgi:hypothetical protein